MSCWDAPGGWPRGYFQLWPEYQRDQEELLAAQVAFDAEQDTAAGEPYGSCS
jgi:hypothetical protein